ncbi:hypothetical protein BIW11_03315 [Tropilaelaps mercedesae]|uniref:Uncharacterized protein n=1 Tax=Tropilaelaps mercedesae TaxID=418985 RepID=A0A1V9XNJ4_9ACAR|nr:hypothetical protein BIW11_03315 [Tropilaelaps mercedesae]
MSTCNNTQCLTPLSNSLSADLPAATNDDSSGGFSARKRKHVLLVYSSAVRLDFGTANNTAVLIILCSAVISLAWGTREYSSSLLSHEENGQSGGALANDRIAGHALNNVGRQFRMFVVVLAICAFLAFVLAVTITMPSRVHQNDVYETREFPWRNILVARVAGAARGSTNRNGKISGKCILQRKRSSLDAFII